MTVADFLTYLDGVRDAGRGWTARCPAHEDRSPSLSIAEGDDGRVLVRCFAGCTVESITSAVGLTVADLFAEKAIVPPTRGRGRSAIASPGGAGVPDVCAETPEALWARVRQEIRRDYREDLAVEQEIAGSIYRLHRRARAARQAVTALSRETDAGLDLLADAAAWERSAVMAEAELDEARARIQMVTFTPRKS